MTPREPSALLVVPPHLRYTSGPALGPALLKGAAEAHGHRVRVLDLAVRRWLSWCTGNMCPEHPRSPFRGDHDRPDAAVLEWSRFEERVLLAAVDHCARSGVDAGFAAMRLPYSHQQVHDASACLLRSDEGRWLRGQFAAEDAPNLVGVSVMHAGQVVWGLAVSRLVREIWPRAPVVWGGAHVTALASQIAADPAYGAQVDGFVIGRGEQAFVRLLDAIRRAGAWPTEVLRAGGGVRLRAEARTVALPAFEDLDLYGAALTLPAQTRVGCAYGRCRFCTYPAIEGRGGDLGLESLRHVVAHAASRRACVAVKDSLLSPARLGEIARTIDGRVEWSGCTKIQPALDAELLRTLKDSGCRTLEVGLETILERSQLLIDKIQPRELFIRLLDAAANAGVPLIVNYITGFPTEDPGAARGALDWVRTEIERRAPSLVAAVEHHEFELERLSPFAMNPGSYGIRITHEWPWSSALGWESAARSDVRDSDRSRTQAPAFVASVR